MKNYGFDYFRAFTEMVQGSMAAARLLDEILKEYDPLALDARIRQMHEIEKSNDMLIHETLRHLIREFLPPIEREDISTLIEELDDPTDAIEDVLFALYMYNITEIRPEAIKFSELIVEAVDTLYEASIEFKNFKNGEDKTKEKIIKVNEIEGRGDNLYIDAIRELYTSSLDPKTIVAWTKVLSKLEKCLDTLEKSANLMEFIMMKNM
ncbi:DUF47 domain-containing protein [Peptoniphilus stercorisuis]|uniref:Uncharacterized protein Yka (UPF0111/DUF47 family) n=1 Tax=Peptoniphilus stercorisuis TaxID=1436965 RepID=A0ABS4KE21_9FIRM|nr:DUF47 family protein [Peptoniphilus stercorisuis]MBP2026019.1 uncharacterized protein Yka (UPF0111/DUF47 family) [Peptoniphilus stercorisuis]